MSEPNKPKLLIDDDWKVEAEKEKEKLAKEAEPAAGGPEGGLPEASFEMLVSDIVYRAMFALGVAADPETGKAAPPDFEMARFLIDLLGVLETKTKGNLDEREQVMLGQPLRELRLAFVQLAGR